MQIALIADDLTGALDAAAPFAARGRVTQVLCRLPAEHTPIAVAAAAVVSINTESRHWRADHAAQAVEAAWRLLAPLSPALLYKKIDSTLRGNVVAETLALLQASGKRYALLTPAYPAQNRTVRGGEVYVAGVPLAQTVYTRDLVSPAPTTPLAGLFEHAGLPAFTGPQPPVLGSDSMIWIADAETEADLQRIAGWALEHAANVLTVGSPGLTTALAQQAFGAPLPLPKPAQRKGIVLFAVGSRAPVSRAQADRLAQQPGCVTVDAPRGAVDVGHVLRLATARSRALLIRVPAEPADHPASAVAEALGAGVARLCEHIAVKALVVTGGDCALAVLNALGHAKVQCLGEWRPGVPLSVAGPSSNTTWLITKAGGFGAPEVFVEALDYFQS